MVRALLFDSLLRKDVAGAEQDGCKASISDVSASSAGIVSEPNFSVKKRMRTG